MSSLERTPKNMNVIVRSLLIPDEVIYSIMLKLPIKSLLRFQALSKQWKDAITNRKFFKHRKMSSPELSVTYFLSARSYYGKFRYELHAYPMTMSQSQGQPRRTIELGHPNIPGTAKIHIISHLELSSDGLLGLIYNEGDEKVSKNSIFLIWNPFTGRQKEVSLPDRDPTLGFGYGYDATIDDYKIILIYDDARSGATDAARIMVRELNKFKGWRIVNFAQSDMVKYSHQIVAVDGDIWWIAQRTSDESLVLMKFSLAEEKLSTVAFPPDAKLNEYKLRTHDESLHLIDWGRQGNEFYIWRIIKQDNTTVWKPVCPILKSGCRVPKGFRGDGALIARLPGRNPSYACISSDKSLYIFELQESLVTDKMDYHYNYKIIVLDTETLISP